MKRALRLFCFTPSGSPSTTLRKRQKSQARMNSLEETLNMDLESALSRARISEETDCWDLHVNMSQLASFYESFSAKGACVGCGSKLDFRSAIESEQMGLGCTKCEVPICICCGKKLQTELGLPRICCEAGRLYSIWAALAKFDATDLKFRNQAAEKRKLRKDDSQRNKIPKWYTGSGSSPNSGVGYGGGLDFEDFESAFNDLSDAEKALWAAKYGPPQPLEDQAPPRPKSPKLDYQEDTLISSTLRHITALLVNPKKGPISFRPEELFLFRLSFLLDRVCDLLRNDSIVDITNRSDTYRQAFVFTAKIANCPELSTLIYEQRAQKKDSPGILDLSQSSTSSSASNVETVSSATLPSLFSCCKDTYTQAKALLELADRKISKRGKKRLIENDESLSVCQNVIDLYNLLSSKAPVQVSKLSKDPWLEFCESNRVTFTEDVLTPHKYHSLFTRSKFTTKSGRMATIGKEIATMTTSLPPGIFLKVAESRSDVMKILIVGGDDSPYSGGLFEFDMFLDGNYPLSPPLVTFTLYEGEDGGGFHGFNPNLHMGGSVCLSILNTWDGAPSQKWQPNKSTMLAVLISIQAMILGAPFPYKNEPGFENAKDSDPKVVSNRNHVQLKTVWYAMAHWLQDETVKTSVWADISKTYWNLNADIVLATVTSWGVTNASLTNLGGPSKPMHGYPRGKDESMIQLLCRLVATHNQTSESVSDGESGGSDDNGKSKRKSSLADDTESEKRRRLNHGSGTSSKTHSSHKWVYTGARTQTEVLNARIKFGVKPGHTIADSIAKLEAAVNAGKIGPNLANEFGEWREVLKGDDSNDEDEDQDFDMIG
ncbi:hypothetical protein BP5796_06955 [Coleophoma crateriformis]|uniref:UBC core domain-containing protein n=1 Tax=Coleophoma crateriformis TaxID=565419 RepID=A0A3D8RQH5_9HELO|nr:hypothetical protein BP5796_06955 [Coleophoma crateriformis]